MTKRKEKRVDLISALSRAKKEKLFEDEEMAKKEEIGSFLKEKRVDFINLQFTDLLGIVKTVTLPLEHFLAETMEYGTWFDGSSIEGFARIAESDMYLVPDLNTLALVPWEINNQSRTARLICDVYTPQGQPFSGDPRFVLDRALKESEKMGFSYFTGPEMEFFLFKGKPGEISPEPQDRASYFDVSTDLATDLRRQMSMALEELGIKVETHHHERGFGQQEIDFHYESAKHTADNVVTLRLAVKAVAQANGLYATFMPKPIWGMAGSGMHVHQSLIDIKSGRNQFYDGDDLYGLSEIAKKFIAGQLYHAPGMCAVLSPLVNSYKRLVSGYEAPVYISWGRTNRSALIRVPSINPHTPQATRIELRSPDPSCNPYLAFAVMLACGLDGIKRNLTLPPPSEENLFSLNTSKDLPCLPGSLYEAIEELKKDTVIKETLGEHVFQRFLEAKTQEWQEYRQQITTWEINRYLPIY